MDEEISGKLETLRRVAAGTIHAHWKVFLIQGVVMMALGLLAAALPQMATLVVEIFVGWLFFIGGIFRTLSAMRTKGAPGFCWSLATALLAIAIGLILVLRPLEGVLTLTIVLTAFFVIEGVAALFVGIEFRRHLRSWGWMLLTGVVNLILAYLIWRGWPGTAGWAIGLLTGISMFFFGLSLAMTALAARTMAPHGNDTSP